MKTIKKSIKSVMFAVFFIGIISCEKQESMIEFESELKNKTETFDFNQFGKTHNAYLEYVMNIERNNNAEARFNHGKTFSDSTFKNFDIGLEWNDIKEKIPFHQRRVNSILKGTYKAKTEKLSLKMTLFLDDLALSVKTSVDNNYDLERFIMKINEIESNIKRTEEIEIDLKNNISNDGASMLAICSILKYSIQYWSVAGNGSGGNGDNLPLANGKIKRALADAWGYVSAWVNNGDGSYSWDHESALVNADCVSDSVR